MQADLTGEGATDEQSIDGAVRALARILFAGRTPEETLQTVATAACETIGSCDSASVTWVRNQRRQTTVATSDVARALDQVQYGSDAGPCIDAMASGHPQRVDDFGADARWPRLAAAAADHGVRSAFGLPLLAAEAPIGSLNLYSFAARGFAGAERAGEAFAGHAAITMANATAYHQATELAQNLAIALDRRDVIGQAKGILMARQGIDADQAFDVLRRASQRGNRKLHELAGELVERQLSGRAED